MADRKPCVMLPIFEVIGQTASGEPIYASVAVPQEERQKWWNEHNQPEWQKASDQP